MGKSTKQLTTAEEQIRSIIAAKKRRARALRLKNSGMSYQEVGDKLGVSRGRAQALVQKALTEVV